MLLALYYNFPSFSCLLLLKNSCLFHFNTKYPDGVQILKQICLTSKISKINLTDDNCNVFEGNLMLQFSWQSNFARETFLGGEHITSSSTKTAQTVNFKLSTYISNRLLHETMPAFFLIMSHSFFIAIIRRVLKAYFA